MKSNKLTIVLLTIIVVLVSFIVYDKFLKNNISKQNVDTEIKVMDKIELDYTSIYLTNDGLAYINCLNEDEINNLNVSSNLKDRLKTIYARSFIYNVYVEGKSIRGFRISLDDDIKSIKRIDLDGNSYIIFIKNNNTIGVFNYIEYYDLLNTQVVDNYNNYKDVYDVKENKLVLKNNQEIDFKIIADNGL